MLDYNLPDKQLLESNEDKGYCIFIPQKTILVLGRSNTIEKSVKTDIAQKDNIEVIKRPSGGESVILSPNTLVVSIKIPIKAGEKPSYYFEKSNDLITQCLEAQNVKNIYSKGISDLSINNKKILGSAIFKTKDSMFYHAVINIAEDINLISKYLKHPTKEPDYRKGRSHTDFVTSLKELGYTINLNEFEQCLIKTLDSSFFI